MVEDGGSGKLVSGGVFREILTTSSISGIWLSGVESRRAYDNNTDNNLNQSNACSISTYEKGREKEREGEREREGEVRTTCISMMLGREQRCRQSCDTIVELPYITVCGCSKWMLIKESVLITYSC
jgi:hypothetical protein